MELENLHKFMHLTNLANGTIEVMFAGQPALTVAKNQSAIVSQTDSQSQPKFYWTINPVFARLTYGANTHSDIPCDCDGEDSAEMAIAAGMAKLEHIGAFRTLVDLPEDTFASTLALKYDEASILHNNDLHNFALDATDHNVMEATIYVKKLKSGKIKPRGDAKAMCEKIAAGEKLSTVEKIHLIEHVIAKTRDVFSADGMPINTTITEQTVKPVETTQETNENAVEAVETQKTVASVFRQFQSRKTRLNEERENKRLLKTSIHKDRAVKVYRCPDTDEYKVEVHNNGRHHEPADYYTSDKDDAHSTADHMLKFKNEAYERSEFVANNQLAAKKPAVTVGTNKVRIIGKSGGTVSKHDSVDQARKEFVKKGYTSKTHSIQEDDDGTLIDHTQLVIESEEAYEKWHAEVQAKHGDKGVKIKGRVEKGAHTSSAEVPGEDRSYAVFDHDTNTGHIFEETESIVGEEFVQERELTDTESAKREEIVLALKKNKGFVSKYGKDAIWAVATAQAKTAGG